MIQGLYAEQLVDELLWLLSDRSGWSSTLMRQSTVGLMEELAEAGVQVANGVLSDSSFTDLKGQTRDQIILDCGLGEIRNRGPLLNQIPNDAREFLPTSYKSKAWRHIVRQLKTSYCQNWRVELSLPQYDDANGPDFPKAVAPFEVASLVAAHLLYLGLSSSYLSRWLNRPGNGDCSTS